MVLLYVHTDGVVVGSPGNFTCAGSCAIPVPRGSLATLHALHRANFNFSGWIGDCVGTQPTCSLALDHDHSVRTVYRGRDVRVVVTVGGPGDVRSEPAGIDCGEEADTCSATFPWGTPVRFVTSGRHSRWGDACRNVAAGAPCTLSIQRLTRVIASFAPESGATDPQLLVILRAFRRPMGKKPECTLLVAPKTGVGATFRR